MSAQQAAPARIQITVNGQPTEVVKDSFLLKTLQTLDIAIPTLCHHKDLTPTGTCRLCVCEIEVRGKTRLVTACNYPVRDEIKVETHSPRVLQHRRLLAEMYLGRWPEVPVIQEVAKACGVVDGGRFRSELTDDSPTACILCGHCVRACEEFMQERILDFAGRGIKRHLTMPYNEVDPHCVGCTSCAHVCPTGAIQVVDDLNGPVDALMIREHGMKINAEMATLDKSQCCMREVGTANIVDVMDTYDLLPVHNYKFGQHPDTPMIGSKRLRKEYLTQNLSDGCWRGCSMGCAKTIDGFELRTGPYQGQRVLVDGPEYETAAGSANMGCFDAEFLAEYNFYCDTYGIDTISFATTMAFVMEAYENGVITKEHTGGKELPFGAIDATLAVLHEMAAGSGFGVDVGKGVRWLKNKWVREYGADAAFLQDIGMEIKGLEFSEYVSKESLAQQAGYALATKGPQHDEAWLIFMDMVNNQVPTFEDKAEALYYFPLFRTWFGLMGLCKLIWNDVVPADNKKYRPQDAAKVPDHVNNFQKFFEGMTGIPLNEKTLLEQSARVYNLQRIMAYMLGQGTRAHDMPPYRAVGPVTREEYESRQARYDKQLVEQIGIDIAGKTTEEKMAFLREYRLQQFDKVVDAAYMRRGWTPDGVPTRKRLQELGIDLPELEAIIRDAW
jgi:aldehyde:ferredoxin oxidoreductase